MSSRILDIRLLAEKLYTTPATIKSWRSAAPHKLPPATIVGRKPIWQEDHVDLWLTERRETVQVVPSPAPRQPAPVGTVGAVKRGRGRPRKVQPVAEVVR